VRVGLAALHELAVVVDVLEPVRPRLPVVGDPGEVVVAGQALGGVLVPSVADDAAAEARRRAVVGVLHDRAGVQDLLARRRLELDLDAEPVRVGERR